jgi:hypothetical protein
VRFWSVRVAPKRPRPFALKAAALPSWLWLPDPLTRSGGFAPSRARRLLRQTMEALGVSFRARNYGAAGLILSAESFLPREKDRGMSRRSRRASSNARRASRRSRRASKSSRRITKSLRRLIRRHRRNTKSPRRIIRRAFSASRRLHRLASRASRSLERTSEARCQPSSSKNRERNPAQLLFGLSPDIRALVGRRLPP